MASAVTVCADIYDRMFEQNVRIAAMWPFPQWEPSEQFLDAFEDRDDRLPPEIAALISGWDEDEQAELFERSDDAHGELASAAHRRGVRGYICIAEQPVFKPTSPTSASFSWGRYRTKMLFAETADALMAAACSWAEEQYKADLATYDPAQQVRA